MSEGTRLQGCGNCPGHERFFLVCLEEIILKILSVYV